MKALQAAALAALLVAGAARAQEEPSPGVLSLEAGGHAKGFLVGLLPYESPLPLDDAVGIGLANGRLRLEANAGDLLSLEVHPELIASTTDAVELRLGPFALGTGAAVESLQAVDLTWALIDGPGGSLVARLDRLAATLRLPFVEVTVGRQAVTFGHMLIFTPMDLLAPFPPVTVDREYKPGVDAARVDVYFGTSGQLTTVASYAGGWDLDGLVLAGWLRQTFGPFDVSALLADELGEPVLGIGAAGELLGLGVRGEATITFRDDEEPFTRAALGVSARAGPLTLLGEVYHQSLGALTPEGYPEVAALERVRREEIFLLGRSYAALSAELALGPLVTLSTLALANLGDASYLVVPGLTWSVADNAELEAGVSLPVGEGPVGLEPRSEFGLLPYLAFVETRLYF